MLSQSVIALSIAETQTGFFLPESVLAFSVFICFIYQIGKENKMDNNNNKSRQNDYPQNKKKTKIYRFHLASDCVLMYQIDVSKCRNEMAFLRTVLKQNKKLNSRNGNLQRHMLRTDNSDVRRSTGSDFEQSRVSTNRNSYFVNKRTGLELSKTEERIFSEIF